MQETIFRVNQQLAATIYVPACDRWTGVHCRQLASEIAHAMQPDHFGVPATIANPVDASDGDEDLAHSLTHQSDRVRRAHFAQHLRR